MNCESIGELLSAYIDRELDRNERMTVEMHLQGCPECQKTVHDFKEMSGIVYKAFGSVNAPVELEQLVVQNIMAIRQSIQTRRLFLVYLASAVLGLLIILSLSISPAGHFMRASICLSVAILHGAINLLSVVGNVWFAMIGVTMLVVFSLSFFGVLRMLRKIQSEAL